MSWNAYSSTYNKAAIFTPKIFPKAITIIKFKNTIVVKLHADKHPISMISAYSSPTADINLTLQEIKNVIKTIPKEKFSIGADLNGHNPLLGNSHSNPRGEAILSFILANNLYINNTPDAPTTFTRNIDKRWNDLTVCSQHLIEEIENWEVLEEPSFSDH
ncbi:hypothetical protein AVEN_101038-1 [Araneus ventricosus]|uniref:Endonuclease/exonuclease/phosphatase domain-containing protein n=1 Tax=Araneus ventricosus TaxID=182803 RepID=A0A4Y2KBS1_ARAVE|nr:hypothetical protein AVEN_101038-1 [Araneus ventricosus]